MSTERLALLLETVGTSGVVKDLERVSGATRGLGDKATKASGLLRSFGATGEEAAATMSGALVAGAAAAGSAIVAFGVKSIGTFEDLGQKVLTFQRASGATAEQSSALVAAFDDVGIAAETGSKAIFQLGKRLEMNAGALHSYGVQAARTSDGTVDLAATLGTVADAYNAQTDPAKRAALLAAAFGKTGQELIPILERGSEGIRKMYGDAARSGQILSQDDIQKAEDFRLAMDQLNDSWQKLEIAAGKALIPIVKGLADAASATLDLGSKLASAGGLTDKIGDALAGGKGARQDPDSFVNTIRLFVDTIVYGSEKADENAAALAGQAEATKGVSDKAAEAASRLDEQRESTEKLKDQVLGVTAAQQSQDEAERRLSSAQQDLADKNAKLNTLLAQGAVNAKEVARARRELTDANKEAEQAATRLTKAQADLTKAESILNDLRTGAAAAKALSDHSDDLGKAQLNLTRAQKRLWDSEDRLLELRNSGTATSREMSDAEDDVTDATFGLHDAQTDLADTQDNLNKLSQIGAENSPEVVSATEDVKTARENVAGATDAVADATQHVLDKTDALGMALAGDPNFTEQVRQARQDVADATQNVADAAQNAGQKAFDAQGKLQGLETAMRNNVGAAQALKAELQALVTQFPEMAPFLGPVLETVRGLIVGEMARQERQVPRNRLGPAVPALAGGGIVTEPLLAHIGEAGPEAVIPLSRGSAGLSGPNIFVTVNTGIAGDVDRVAAEVHGALSRLAKRGFGSPWNN